MYTGVCSDVMYVTFMLCMFHAPYNHSWYINVPQFLLLLVVYGEYVKVFYHDMHIAGVDEVGKV